MKRSPADKEAADALDLLGKGAPVPLEKLIALAPRLVRLIDAETARALGRPDPKDSEEDRLFDALMTRFEILGPHRSGITALAALARRTPPLAAALARAQTASMRACLAHARPALGTEAGGLRALALLGLYHFVFCAWERDFSPDLSLTMARLNSTLNTCKSAILYYPK